jgi:preprotein translocase subunit SecG
MSQVILIGHVIVGLCIIALVMMQQGKGADAGAAFGGGGASGSLFGASGAGTFLSRATAVLAVVFFSTSMGLAFLGGHQEGPKDLMDVDPVLLQQELTDLPIIDGAVQQVIPEDVPAAAVEQEKAVESMTDEMPVIEQLEQKTEQAVSSLKEIKDSVVEDMPILSDDVPAATN